MARICVVGAGAVGGVIGARLAAAGNEVSALARGATLAALRAHGWRLETDDGVLAAPVLCASDDPAALGPQDLVVVTVKAHALTPAAGLVRTLLGPQTVVLPLMNGVPWWFGHGTALGDEPLRSVDPGGAIAAAIPLDSVLGGVVHLSATTPEPGAARLMTGNGIIVGEPAGGLTARAEHAGGLLTDAGFDVTVSADVRHDVWYKLWGNLTMNPVTALTGATADRVLADPLVRELCSTAMQEAAAVGAAVGVVIDSTPEDRHAVTARLGALTTSMLQDVRAGRPLELDAIVGAVHEMGLRLGVPTPGVDALLGLTRLFARVRGLYPSG